MCARSDEERKAIDTVLGEFFEASKIGFTHRRVQKEIYRMNAISAQASVNGIKGNEIKNAKASHWRRSETREGVASQKLEARSYKLEPEEPKIKPRFARPDWIESQVWFDFEEMRKKERHPLTDGARIGIVRELEKLRSGGSDPNAVLQQSINRGWRGVFEIKTGDQNGKRGPVTAQDHINRSIRDAEILGLVSSRKPS